MSWYLKKISSTWPYFCLFLLMGLLFGAADPTSVNGANPDTASFPWWCVAGGYAAVIWKNLCGALKHYFEGKFNFWLMLLPLVVNSVFAAPFVIGIITILNISSASVLKDIFVSFPAVYTIIDGVWFLFKMSGVVNKFAEKKTKEKNERKK